MKGIKRTTFQVMRLQDLPVTRCQVWECRHPNPDKGLVKTLHIREVSQNELKVRAWCEEENKVDTYSFEFLQDYGELTERQTVHQTDEEIARDTEKMPEPGDIAWYIPEGQVDISRIQLVVVTNLKSGREDALECVFMKNNPAVSLPKSRLKV